MFVLFLDMPFSHLDLGRLDGIEKLGRGLLAVALGVVAHPAPQILAGLFHRLLRLPVELLVGERGVGRQVQDIALAAADNLVGKVAADDGAKGLDNVKDGAATSRAKVPGLDAGLAGAQVLQGGEMALGEVDDVNVVANCGAVLGSVI